jgi:hypothetical protein
VFDLRLVPIAYGLGHVGGLLAALALAVWRGTSFKDEAAELPLYTGLGFATVYTVFLVRGLLLVS